MTESTAFLPQQQGTTHLPAASDVIVIGAGPVGATLALDLALRGVSVMLLEKQAEPRKLPKMERCNARTMEFFRRMGIAERLRAASKYTGQPMDVFLLAGFDKPPLVHLPYPGVFEDRRRIAACHDGSLPLEPAQLISQYTLEPILRDAAMRAGAVFALDCEVTAFTQDDHGVSVAVSGAGGARTLRCRYLVACDGGASGTRKALGIALGGDGRIRPVHQTFFRSETLYEQVPCGRGRHYYFPEATIVVQDDMRHFMMNFTDWTAGQDARQRIRAVIGIDCDIDLLHEGDWHHNLLVADRYRDGRVFLAGDAAHLVIPQGALGMNTGAGDATNLAWKLAGTLQGWGGAGLLDSYEIERRPVALRNVEASRWATEGVFMWKSQIAACYRDDTPAGAANRALVAPLALTGIARSYEMRNAEWGYDYAGSPLIATEPRADAPFDPRTYRPTAAPGARLPHLWTRSGSALADLLGPGYTLLAFEALNTDAADAADAAGTAAFCAAMQALGAPCALLSIDEPALRDFCAARLVLLRPDQHVAWRGDTLPDAVGALARQVCGRPD